MPASSIHPATYSNNLIAPIADLILQHRPANDHRILLDPFAGLGRKLRAIAALVDMEPLGIEIEPGYRHDADPCIVSGDSTTVITRWLQPDLIEAAVTSPVYPNGMTDNYHAKDMSARHTYVHRLREHHGPGYELHPNNAAGTNARRSPAARSRFYEIHAAVYAAVHAALAPGAPFIVNTKNTLTEPFTALTRTQLMLAGFDVIDTQSIPCGGLNHGANHGNKVDHEDLTVALKPAA